jgi:hypothetical protein
MHVDLKKDDRFAGRARLITAIPDRERSRRCNVALGCLPSKVHSGICAEAIYREFLDNVCWETDVCVASYRQLVALTAYSIWTVKAAVERLVQLDLILKEHRRLEDGSLGGNAHLVTALADPNCVPG